jgi:hypothetical protein
MKIKLLSLFLGMDIHSPRFVHNIYIQLDYMSNVFLWGKLGQNLVLFWGGAIITIRALSSISLNKVPRRGLTCHIASSHNRNFDKFLLFRVIFLPLFYHVDGFLKYFFHQSYIFGQIICHLN